MRRSVIAAVLVLPLLLLLAVPAAADREWCPKDPVVRLNGTPVQILVAVPVGDVHRVTGPIEVAVATPADIARELVLTDAGFNGFGEEVGFVDLSRSEGPGTRFPVRVTVRVPTSGGAPIPMQVAIIPDNARAVVAEGSSTGLALALPIAER